jgi:RimJ/RimL family protein N-acetyltransferase
MGNAVNYILDQCNVYEKYSTDATMFGWGLSVSNKFRGRGIANEILKARIPFCKAIGVKLSTTIFTNRISQKCAESVGFKDDYAIAYDELVKIDSGWDFRKTPTKVCKMKSLCID